MALPGSNLDPTTQRLLETATARTEEPSAILPQINPDLIKFFTGIRQRAGLKTAPAAYAAWGNVLQDIQSGRKTVAAIDEGIEGFLGQTFGIDPGHFKALTQGITLAQLLPKLVQQGVLTPQQVQQGVTKIGGEAIPELQRAADLVQPPPPSPPTAQDVVTKQA